MYEPERTKTSVVLALFFFRNEFSWNFEEISWNNRGVSCNFGAFSCKRVFSPIEQTKISGVRGLVGKGYFIHKKATCFINGSLLSF